MVVCSCRRQVSYLMAEASWKRRIVGDIAWALGVVPVKRAQDEATAGSGKIRLQNPTKVHTDGGEVQILIMVEGAHTKFSQELTVGDKIRPQGTAFSLKIKSIENDTCMVVDGMDLADKFPVNLFPANAVPKSYDLMKRTPLTTVFEKVLDKLAGGGALGIFPEGGSHDRTDLLPLKVGISLIAYSALEKDGIQVPVVPVGLSYFRAHRWRGRAVVEYGRPFYIDPLTLDDFKAGGAKRRKVCNMFLEEVEKSMRSVILSAPDYETLELIHTARRLYQRKKGPMDTIEKQDLSRRFVEGYKRLLLMTDGKPSSEWLELQARISAYRNELKDLGLKDYQVPALKEEHLDEKLGIEKVNGDNVIRFLQLPYNIVHKLVLILVSAIPMLLLNLPVGILAGLYSERRRIKALANSIVKVKGFDVSENDTNLHFSPYALNS
jgi:glycerol-3-phosphate O-acyltransferase/dihydroxyacetone phosphate acyltransferase